MNLDDQNARPEQIDSRRGRLWRHADFMKLWAGETVSVFGSRMGDVAISFAAVIALGATPFQMSLLATARIIPGMIFALAAGVWVDRLRRRPILIFADIGRFILLGTIPLAALFGRLGMTQLCTVILAVSALDLVFNVAYRAYLPALVGREDLVEANSKLSASYAVAEVGGFGIVGWLVQWLSAPIAILVDAVSFLASAFAIGIIATPEPPPDTRQARDMMREIREGARFVASDPRLFVLAGAAPFAALAMSMWSTLFMLFVVNDLGFAPGALGMIFATGGLASLASALATTRTTDALGAGRAIAFSLVLQGMALALVPLAHGAALVSVALLVGQQLFGDFAGTVFQITVPSITQALAPDRIIGRVTATISFVSRAATLVGALLAGWLGGAVGVRTTMLAGSVGMVAAGVMLAFSPVWSIGDASAQAPRD